MIKYNDFNVYTDSIPVDQWTGKAQALIYLPNDYKTKQYPVFWFWNGLGEDTGPVSVLAKWGPFAFINKDWQPNFIVIAVQALEWKNSDQLDIAYKYIKSTYNTGKVVASGLSAGGYGVTKLLSFYPYNTITKDLVAIIPMSTSEGYGQTVVQQTVDSKVGVWAFGDDPGDVHGINAHKFYISLVAKNPTGKYKWTNMNPRGHGGWNDYYNPKYTENGLNIYDWGMSFVTDTPSVPTTPTRNLIATIKVYDNGDVEKE